MLFSPILILVFSKVACFHGGNFILGGLTLGERAYVDLGLALVEGCHATYVGTATGIGPEVFAWQDSQLPLNATNNPPPPKDQAAFYEKSGFWITNGHYVLRPEVIESYYYAYRATGDTKYQDWAWDAFKRINETCRVGSGFSSIKDVNAPGGGEFDNFQESFWFAEVLKYSYLIHSEVSRRAKPLFRDLGLTNHGNRMPRGRSRLTTRTNMCGTPRLIRYGWPVGSKSDQSLGAN